jgi:hypothetical protein
VKFPTFILLFLAVTLAPAGADDFSGDMATVRAFLDKDRSYSPAERAAVEAGFAKLKTGAANMTPAQFQLAVAHLAALARNGHTMLLPGVWAHQFNRVPVQYHVFADGMRVVHAPDAMRDLLGVRVVSIDGETTEALRRAFGKYFGGRDSKRDEWVGFYVESPAILHAAGLAKAPDRVEVRFELANGASATRVLTAALDPPKGEVFDFLDHSRLVTFAAENAASGTVPLYLRKDGQAFRFVAMPDLDANYMQLRINKSYYDQKMDAFLGAVSAALKKSSAKALIIDLRLDGGGDLNTTGAFWGKLPSLLPADARVFVLTSGRTFSAGIASAGYIRQALPGRVTIVGEPIGDFLEFYAEGGPMQLPVSKAMLLPATERHNYMTGCPEPDCHSSIRDYPIRVTSLEPDIAAPLTYADYRAGRDVALEAVRKALGK